LIVRGPPGTGKSQTISNLIATLIARGKKVLFVAEKRAAIDAVLKRLHTQGLAELVLDLHGGTGAKRKLAQDLAATLQTNARIPRPDVAPRPPLGPTPPRRAQ
jgi:nitrogenase subunit NifH